MSTPVRKLIIATIFKLIINGSCLEKGIKKYHYKTIRNSLLTPLVVNNDSGNGDSQGHRYNTRNTNLHTTTNIFINKYCNVIYFESV